MEIQKTRKDLMTIEELAHYLKVKPRTIYEWLKQGKIPAIKLVGQWRFRKESIDRWLQQHEIN
ncbi:MAG: helix-turn-helix domain-containing protein [Candidatus Omnitrophica bacterium]|nr:helix-turn-helix domain-containing protein [Candidatus Omnitrophota bacterium]